MFNIKIYTHKIPVINLLMIISLGCSYSGIADTQKAQNKQSTADSECDISLVKESIKKYRDAGLHEFLNEVCFVLLAQEKYGYAKHGLAGSRVRWLREHRDSPGGRIPVRDKKKKLLAEIQDHLQKAIDGFGTKKKGVINIPKSLIGQLRQASALMDVSRTGDSIQGSSYGYDVHEADARLEFALDYSISWAQDGFD